MKKCIDKKKKYAIRNGIVKIILFFKVIPFYKKYPDIYIYGKGYYGNEVADCLEKWGMIYAGFLVTSNNGGETIHRYHKVAEFKKELMENPSTGIIIGMNKANCESVMESKLSLFKGRVLLGFEQLII